MGDPNQPTLKWWQPGMVRPSNIRSKTMTCNKHLEKEDGRVEYLQSSDISLSLGICQLLAEVREDYIPMADSENQGSRTKGSK